MLEEAGYIVSTHTKSDWVVTTPKGKNIFFKRDKGICNRMPYIDLRESMEGFTMIETIRKKFAGATNREMRGPTYPAPSKEELDIHLMRGLRRL